MKLSFVILLSLSFFACQEQQQPKDSPAGTASSHYNGNVSLLASVNNTANDQAPNFTWYDENGAVVSFAEYSKGKPVVINFWATWCGPCIKETPDLVELNEEFSSKGALFIGISADRGDDAMELVVDFTKEYKVPYQIVVDNNGDLQEAFGGLRGYPTTFYVDKNGKIVKKLVGLQSKQKFSQELIELI